MAKLGDIAKNISRKFNFNKNEQVVFINTGDVLNNKFLHQNLSNKDDLPGQAKKAIKKGDILYSEIRPGNGRYLLVKDELDNYVVSTKFMVIECDQKVLLPEFLFLVLISDEVTSYFKVIAESRSGTFPQITFDSIAHYEINIPSLEKQKEIVEILSSLDEKIELNTQTNQTLEQIAQAIFKSWFVDFEPVKAKMQGGNLAAMEAISGKNSEELHRLQTENPTEYQKLWAIADAFPDEIGEDGVPVG